MTQSAVKVDPIVIGIVKDLDDPQKLGRVRVALPHLDDQESDWARVATMMAGADRGSLFRPEPEDEVLVAFLHGDPMQPYIIGALWNEQDVPPEGGGTKENHRRTLRSRSGHVFRFDDTPGEEKIELVSSAETQRILIDVATPVIAVEADDGDISVKAGKADVMVEAESGNVTVKAAEKLVVEAGDVTIEASGTVTIKGSTVEIN